MASHVVWKDSEIKYRIVEKYYTTIENYFLQLENAIESNKNIDVKNCMMIGLNLIHRIFDYVLIRTKNIEKAYYYAERTCIYYIEYVEQIHKTNLHMSLNQSDAILFVYKKTIFELDKGDDNKVFDTITNIMTFDEEITKLNDDDYSSWMAQLFTIIHSFFYWSNETITFAERRDMSKILLKQYMNNADKMKLQVAYLEILQEKLTIQYGTYKELLLELLDFQMTNTTIECVPEEEILLKFYVEKNIIYQNYENNDIKEIVKWLYKPISMSTYT